MRVAAHQLGDDAARDVVDAELALGEAQLRLEDDLQQQVAQLFAVIVDVSGRQRVDHLVGLLDQVGHQRRQGLLAIPGASVGREQPLHQTDQLAHLGAGLLAREGRQVGEGRRRGQGVRSLTSSSAIDGG